jgi:hypothetical protein
MQAPPDEPYLAVWFFPPSSGIIKKGIREIQWWHNAALLGPKLIAGCSDEVL